ncbi:ABC transporter ATP-binding protein [Paracoccus aerodenitrificans]|uniref:ABC transporter ATP-binding protein n=1 Tax=Paracoccus aerodenitrificans TaxID=3017781 RepID=UPI0022F0C784|nr:ABC transporter ATP-binding protein [Paracoccus aerodenitrificans]WBU63986.1 ABC transporter ATP-binding protein [Paracoccus aerodenitrificans]
MRFDISDLSVRRGRNVTLNGVTLNIGPGECVGLIGPNGAGKTTLLRAALGLIPASGKSSLAALPPARRALAAAWLPQTREAAWPVSVEALIRLGRIPHRRPEADPAHIEAALTRMGLTHLRRRRITELSGGEQARTLIARALAQNTPVLLADEPVAGLDPAYQISVMALFRELADEGRTVIVSLHDLGLAARHCTRLVLMDRGRIVADGTPHDVLIPDHLAQVFGIEGYFANEKEGPVFQPLRILP